MSALRAFAVTENDESTGAIYFAKHDIVAKKWGANEFADGEIGYVSCRRAPWADAYVGKPLPVSVMIENGWHFGCHGCGMRMDEDELRERHLPVDGVIGSQHSAVYCCARCRRKHLSRQRRKEAEQQLAIESFKAIVRKRFPEVEFINEHPNWQNYARADFFHGQKGWIWQRVTVAFTFPGMKIAPAWLELPERPWRGYGEGNRSIGPLQPAYTCCNGDREAFETYAAATRTQP
ncbi:hypothetical protein C8D77_111168 [Mesorhizobium loti]|uniref:Uncharacterized protein n=1 Tax=Rhizobium loti TaxID=381 RepID=A0A8E2WBD8_RHILI|nr:hypothetical protein [Mesorhizobium loti]PWJ88445.1 hypothetical protein C8D77_111168 [Mesorhizobium loti]